MGDPNRLNQYQFFLDQRMNHHLNNAAQSTLRLASTIPKRLVELGSATTAAVKIGETTLSRYNSIPSKIDMGQHMLVNYPEQMASLFRSSSDLLLKMNLIDRNTHNMMKGVTAPSQFKFDVKHNNKVYQIPDTKKNRQIVLKKYNYLKYLHQKPRKAIDYKSHNYNWYNSNARGINREQREFNTNKEQINIKYLQTNKKKWKSKPLKQLLNNINENRQQRKDLGRKKTDYKLNQELDFKINPRKFSRIININHFKELNKLTRYNKIYKLSFNQKKRLKELKHKTRNDLQYNLNKPQKLQPLLNNYIIQKKNSRKSMKPQTLNTYTNQIIDSKDWLKVPKNKEFMNKYSNYKENNYLKPKKRYKNVNRIKRYNNYKFDKIY